MSDNKSPLTSDHRTSAGSKYHDSDGVSWCNYSGTKDSHDVQVNQMNSKNYEGKYGEHAFYSPKSGREGIAGCNADRKKR